MKILLQSITCKISAIRLVALILLLCLMQHSWAQNQLPVKRGRAGNACGMFYYDVEDAEDMRHRKYIYTIAPGDVGCIKLDFKLIQAKAGKDFIRVYAGEEATGEPLATFGPQNKVGSITLQQNAVTFEFIRDSVSLYSNWSATWLSRKGQDCPDNRRPQDCEDVREICGPSYHEQFVVDGFGEQNETGDPGSCLAEEHNSIWYRFTTEKEGILAFTIRPDNGYDDYDWALWKGDPLRPFVCPKAIKNGPDRKACNYAAARGPGGITGLDDFGDAYQVETNGSPFSKSFEVQAKEVFFLLVDCHEKKMQGFEIQFSDVVTKCSPIWKEQESQEIVRIGVPANFGKPVIRPSDQFTKYTKIIRIDLNEKINRPLAECAISEENYTQMNSVYSAKACTGVSMPANASGIVMALLMGMKSTRLPAYSAVDHVTPLHYGDILRAAYRINPDLLAQVAGPDDPVFGTNDNSWWDADRALFMGYENAFELIVDEVFDRNTGTKRQIIRYVRIVWTDWEGTQPDYNVAVFRYADILDFLDQISVMLPQNDSGDLTLRDVLEGNLYNGILVGRAGKNITSVAQGKREENKQLEFQNYIWEH